MCNPEAGSTRYSCCATRYPPPSSRAELQQLPPSSRSQQQFHLQQTFLYYRLLENQPEAKEPTFSGTTKRSVVHRYEERRIRLPFSHSDSTQWKKCTWWSTWWARGRTEDSHHSGRVTSSFPFYYSGSRERQTARAEGLLNALSVGLRLTIYYGASKRTQASAANYIHVFTVVLVTSTHPVGLPRVFAPMGITAGIRIRTVWSERRNGSRSTPRSISTG